MSLFSAPAESICKGVCPGMRGPGSRVSSGVEMPAPLRAKPVTMTAWFSFLRRKQQQAPSGERWLLEPETGNQTEPREREMLMEMPAVQDQKSKLPDKGLRGKQEKGPTRGSAAL